MDALLALEDGRIFPCRSFTGPGETSGEVVFNTSMSGYQEVLTDPSYSGQMVTMTYPLIGNYGVNTEDVESNQIQVAAFIIREYQQFPSNYRSTGLLADYLKDQNILGVDQLDTRALTRHIRTAGAMRAVLSTQAQDPQKLIQQAQQTPSMQGQNLASVVSTRTPYAWQNNQQVLIDTHIDQLGPQIWQTNTTKHKVIAFDFGIKYNIIRWLEEAGCEVIVVPATTPATVVKAMQPDGIFLSNGPGDPEPVTDAIATIRELLEYRPIFGICLGIQILSLALGGQTYKLKFGHRGINQPVKNLASGRIEITSQNHGFAVDMNSLKNVNAEITHVNLNDNTVEGFKHRQLPIFAVQYHPEASPGPHDAKYLFKEFATEMARNS
jgi:carbamoyl-phosphate synthase small subunit